MRRVPKSIADRFGGQFRTLVEAHRVSLLDHRFSVNVPAPVADPWVDACVVRTRSMVADVPDDFVIEFEIYDDAEEQKPAPQPELVKTFEEQKRDLLGSIAQAEHDEKAKLVPLGKQRLWRMRRDAIIRADFLHAKAEGERFTKAAEPLAAEALAKQQPPDLSSIPPITERQRPPDEQQFMEEWERISARMEVLARHAAEVMAQVEDLPPEALADWQMPAWPA